MHVTFCYNRSRTSEKECRMKDKKPYIPALATFVAVNRDDVIRTSAFDGPGDPLFPKIGRVYYEDSDLENL